MWWERQLEDLAPQIAAAVRARRGGIDAEALAGDVALDLVRLLRTQQARYPTSWFGDGEPDERDRAAFRTLVQTLARRRHLDQLRRHYVRARELPPADAPEPWLEPLIDARALLVHLARLLERLPARDRDLVTGVLAPARGGGLGARDRQRLARLRRRLARDLAVSIRSGRK